MVGFGRLMGFYCLIVLGLLAHCGNQTTAQLLDTDFIHVIEPEVRESLRIRSDSSIEKSTQFEVEVTAFANANINPTYTGELTWSLEEGAGQLFLRNAPGWSEGYHIYRLEYVNDSLNLGDSEVIVLRATDNFDNDVFGLSNSITVNTPVQMSHFEIEAPATALAEEEFSITITAVGTDNQVFPDYNGVVDINSSSVNSSTGSLNQASAQVL